MSLCLFLAFVAIVLFLVSYFYMTRNFKYWHNKNVKYIPTLPFFGSYGDYFFRKTPPGILIKNFFNKFSKERYVGFYAFDKPCLLLIDPDIIKQIFVTDFKYFTNKFTHSSTKDILSNRSLPFLQNKEWKLWREKLSPAFTPTQLKKNFLFMKKMNRELDHYLNSLNLDDVGIDIKELCAQYTTNVVGIAQYGIKLNSFQPGDLFRKFGKQMFGEYGYIRSKEIDCIFMASHWANFFDFRFFEKVSAKFFEKEFAKILNDRSEDSVEKKEDFVDLLLQIKKHNESVTIEELTSQAIVFFNAGFDTSSTVMALALKNLALNLNIQRKLRSTIMDVTQGEEISYEMIQELRYLQNVVWETLRMHPTVPTIDRIAGKDYTIRDDGLVIQKGTPIFISLLGLHHNKKYFPNPEVFDPERFSDKNKGLNNPAYMPFGIGPRKCIAYKQGLMYAYYFIAHLISKYEVTLPDTTSGELKTNVYFTMGNGSLNLNLRKL